MFGLYESCSKSKTCYMLHVREIAEKFLSPLLLYLHVTLFSMHVRYTASEKEFDVAIQMTPL